MSMCQGNSLAVLTNLYTKTLNADNKDCALCHPGHGILSEDVPRTCDVRHVGSPAGSGGTHSCRL